MTSSKIIVEDGMSSFQTTIVNNTKKDYKLTKFTIIVKDKNNKIIAENNKVRIINNTLQGTIEKTWINNFLNSL